MTEKPGVRIDVTAFQWQWRFAYPGTEVSLVGSADRPARLGARIDVVITTSSFARWLPISPRLPTPP